MQPKTGKMFPIVGEIIGKLFGKLCQKIWIDAMNRHGVGETEELGTAVHGCTTIRGIINIANNKYSNRVGGSQHGEIFLYVHSKLGVSFVRAWR